MFSGTKWILKCVAKLSFFFFHSLSKYLSTHCMQGMVAFILKYYIYAVKPWEFKWQAFTHLLECAGISEFLLLSSPGYHKNDKDTVLPLKGLMIHKSDRVIHCFPTWFLNTEVPKNLEFILFSSLSTHSSWNSHICQMTYKFVSLGLYLAASQSSSLGYWIVTWNILFPRHNDHSNPQPGPPSVLATTVNNITIYFVVQAQKVNVPSMINFFTPIFTPSVNPVGWSQFPI